MLVLSRRIGQTYFIGDDNNIVTTVLDIKGNQVKLGISAPRDIPINRKEILLRRNELLLVPEERVVIE